MDDQLQAVRETLEGSIAQTGRHYSYYFTFAIRFEADNTSAFRDTAHFQDIVQLLGLPRAEELVIKKDDVRCSYTVLKLVQELYYEKISKVEGRALVIGHYAGHGVIDRNDKLAFTASSPVPPAFSLERSLVDLYDDCQPVFENTDKSSPVRANQKDFGCESASNLSRVQNPTFTSRLADSIALRVGKGDSSYISFAEIVEELRGKSQPDRFPEYHLQLGRMGIKVPILSQVSSTEGSPPAAIPTTTQLRAIFTIRLDNIDTSSAETRNLVEWLQALDPATGLELTGVYRSRSTVLVLEGPWRIWAQLDGLRGVTLVCETFGRNMLPRLPSDNSNRQSAYAI